MFELKNKEEVLNEVAAIFETIKEEQSQYNDNELLDMALVLYTFKYTDKQELSLDEITFTVNHLLEVLQQEDN